MEHNCAMYNESGGRAFAAARDIRSARLLCYLERDTAATGEKITLTGGR